MIIDKVVRLGTQKCGRRVTDVYCRIKYEHNRLSITGVIGPLSNGNVRCSAGQVLDRIHISNYAEGWNKAMVTKFIEIWREHHLNDFHPGCEHQRQLGWEADGYDAHPSEPCPVCGYEFGTAWKSVPVPDDVLQWLNNLPDTDKNPAWV